MLHTRGKAREEMASAAALDGQPWGPAEAAAAAPQPQARLSSLPSRAATRWSSSAGRSAQLLGVWHGCWVHRQGTGPRMGLGRGEQAAGAWIGTAPALHGDEARRAMSRTQPCLLHTAAAATSAFLPAPAARPAPPCCPTALDAPPWPPRARCCPHQAGRRWAAAWWLRWGLQAPPAAVATFPAAATLDVLTGGRLRTHGSFPMPGPCDPPTCVPCLSHSHRSESDH